MELDATLDSKYIEGLSPTLLNAIHLFEKRVKPQQLILARYFTIPERPRLLINGRVWRWEFELQGGAYGYSNHETSVLMEFDPGKLGPNGDLSSFSSVHKLSVVCGCYDTKPCVHSVASLNYLRKQLHGVSPQDSEQWIHSCVSDGREIGRRIISELAQIESSNEQTDEDTFSRIQWRVSGLNSPATGLYRPKLEILGYLQTQKKRGGWTKGRQLKNFFEQVPDAALSNPTDRTLATLLQISNDSYHERSLVAVRECLSLLRDHPNVVFDDEYMTPCRVHFAPLEFHLEADDNEVYRPSLFFGGHRIDAPMNELMIGEVSPTKFLLVIGEVARGRLWVSEIDGQTRRMLSQMERAFRKQATFDKEMAEQLADVVAMKSADRSLQINLPESLAGPEQTLEPILELHLSPHPPSGLTAALRVSCDATTEPPVPGMEPERLRIVTPAGRFQLIRDLPEESRRADEIASQCELGRLINEGPYTWLAENEEKALDLIERLQNLGEAGPTVCWPKSPAMRILGEITPQRLQVRLSSQRDWFGVDGTASLDGLEIPLAELLAALRSRRRFVPLGDGQFAMISEQLRDRLTAIHDVAQSEAGNLRVSRAATAIVQEALGSDISYESDLRWQDAMARLNQAQELTPTVPAGLIAELRDYQKTGYEWLARLSHWGLGGCLADDMGLGKTVQALGILLDRAENGPALIVAPTSVGINWVRECARFAPSLKPKLYREHDRQHLVEMAGPGDLVITSYQLLQRDVDRFSSRPWNTLVLDEAQFIKNFQTKTAQAVRELDADWRLALSGTPLENHVGELWSLIRVVSPGLLGSWERFRKSFAEPIERDHSKERLQALGRIVRPFILRRTKKEVLTELPARNEIIRFAEFSDEERKKYDAARMAALSELTNATGNPENEQQKRIRVLAWLTRLRQLSCHPHLVDPAWDKSSAKLDLFMEIVEELREGEHRALVFSQFVQHLSLVRKALDAAGVKYQYLDGSTPTNRRQEAVDKFQAGEGELFLISLKAGGTGLNLTAADYVLHLDPWWNPAVEDQATDRAHRIGQLRSVTVYRLVAKDTIEEQILALHGEKRELISGVLEGADRAGRLNTDELVSMIRLSQVQSNE
ncbi:MAG: SNF2-related protein [Pirellulaceae bacterium]|nr:SNF2-related protein [Pirellulaceae bacterium]